jgi:hypothetical protein
MQERLLKDGFRKPIDKSKWISRNNFNGIVGIATTGNGFDRSFATCVARDPSVPPNLINFREDCRENRLHGSFKF